MPLHRRHGADRRRSLDQCCEHARSALIRNVAVAGLVMAAADYVMSRRRIDKQIRMTKHEVKQEHKQTEGDPLIKGAIRSRQLAAARNRMMADVPTADVVLVNPTHVAVALQVRRRAGRPAGGRQGRRRGRRQDPRAGRRAPRCRWCEDVPLARALLHVHARSARRSRAELFSAVAQVLAFVISRRNRGRPAASTAPPAALAAGRQPAPTYRRRRDRSPKDSLRCRPHGRPIGRVDARTVSRQRAMDGRHFGTS